MIIIITRCNNGGRTADTEMLLKRAYYYSAWLGPWTEGSQADVSLRESKEFPSTCKQAKATSLKDLGLFRKSHKPELPGKSCDDEVR